MAQPQAARPQRTTLINTPVTVGTGAGATGGIVLPYGRLKAVSVVQRDDDAETPLLIETRYRARDGGNYPLPGAVGRIGGRQSFPEGIGWTGDLPVDQNDKLLLYIVNLGASETVVTLHAIVEVA